jgi:DNA replication protein DnaC
MASTAAASATQLVSSRYERASMIVTSNKQFGKAHMFAATCARQRLQMHGFAGSSRVHAIAVRRSL